MKINKDILIEFKAITSRNVESFFRNSLLFFSQDYDIVTRYYEGKIETIDSKIFDRFVSLKRECAEVFETIHSYSHQLNNIKWWLLIEHVEDIDSRLQSLDNIAKWCRSSATRTTYSAHVNIQYTLKQNQTLERASSDIALSTDQDGWVDIAIDNALREEDYSSEGGVDLQLKLRGSNQNSQINSVVAIMQGKSVYGIDIDKLITFVYDDIKVLSYDETVSQSVSILSSLKRNDNPDKPNQGVQSAIVVGGSKASLNFPIINRQIIETFNTDDSLKNFTINKIEVERDNLLIDYQVETRLGETLSGQVFI